jgi:hypothetical protein
VVLKCTFLNVTRKSTPIEIFTIQSKLSIHKFSLFSLALVENFPSTTRKMSKGKVCVAYSGTSQRLYPQYSIGAMTISLPGGLDTSTILRWLLDEGYEVVCFLCDVGQEEPCAVAVQPEPWLSRG